MARSFVFVTVRLGFLQRSIHSYSHVSCNVFSLSVCCMIGLPWFFESSIYYLTLTHSRWDTVSPMKRAVRFVSSRPGSFFNEKHSIYINWIFPTYLHPTEKFWKFSFPLFRRLFENSRLCFHKLSIENQGSLGVAVSKFPGQNILIYSFHTNYIVVSFLSLRSLAFFWFAPSSLIILVNIALLTLFYISSLYNCR